VNGFLSKKALHLYFAPSRCKATKLAKFANLVNIWLVKKGKEY